MEKFAYVMSPLDQFEIRNFIVLDLPILNYIQISLTNIGFYLIISISIALILSGLANNSNKIVPNSWSISQEAIYATIYNIVINQIGASKGQIYFPFIYSLFTFILINNLLGMVGGCLYDIIDNIDMLSSLFISKQKVKYHSSSIYSSSNYSGPEPLNNGNFSNNLNPYYLTGFIDGEGCFNISIYKDTRMLTGWQVKPIFNLSLHNKDRALLESIKRSLGVGKIYKHGKDSLQLRISGLKNLRVVIKHLDKYLLITKKLADYILFKQAVELVQEKEHLTKDGLLKLVSIKASLNWGLSEKSKESFPGVIPVTKPSLGSIEIKDFNWLRGFALFFFESMIQKKISRRMLPSCCSKI